MFEVIILSIMSILLIRLSYTDWLNKVIEVPITLYATGIMTAAYLFTNRYYEFLFFSIFFILTWMIAKPFFENKKLIGEGDISVLSFLIPTAWFIQPYYLPIFLFLIGITTAILYHKDLTHLTEYKPMIPPITIAWIITWIILTLTGLI